MLTWYPASNPPPDREHVLLYAPYHDNKPFVGYHRYDGYHGESILSYDPECNNHVLCWAHIPIPTEEQLFLLNISE